MVTNRQRCGAAAVMKNHALLMVVERFLNTGNELITKETVTGEVGAILEVDDLDVGGFIGFNGELIELDNGIMLLTDVIVGDEWGGSTDDGTRHHGGEAKRRIFWVLILMISWLVGFVDDDEAEVFDGSEEGRAWADDDAR